jgi:hypothetical protein
MRLHWLAQENAAKTLHCYQLVTRKPAAFSGKVRGDRLKKETDAESIVLDLFS